MTATVTQHVKDITQKIVREFDPDKIILFGSQAWGNPSEESDIDLFIIKKVRTDALSVK
jgi:predicted nucleotidyltransferase